MKANDIESLQAFKSLVEGWILDAKATTQKVQRRTKRKSIRIYLMEDASDQEYRNLIDKLHDFEFVDEIEPLDSVNEYKKDLFYRMHNRPQFNFKKGV